MDLEWRRCNCALGLECAPDVLERPRIGRVTGLHHDAVEFRQYLEITRCEVVLAATDEQEIRAVVFASLQDLGGAVAGLDIAPIERLQPMAEGFV